MSISRRAFLCGAGGAIALPWMESLVTKKRACGQSAQAPKRLIVFFTPGGTCPPAWIPSGTETSFTLPDILSPLAPHQSDLLVLKGVAAVSADADVYDNHMKGMAHMLTGTAMVDSDNAGGISVDQYIAQRLNAPTRFATLEFGVQTPTGWPPPMSYLGSAQPVPYEDDPVKMYTRIFAGGVPGSSSAASAAAAALKRKRSILDTVVGELGLLKPRLATADRAKLDAHLTVVRDIESRLGAIATTSCAQPSQPAATALTDDNIPAILQLQIDLMWMALTCDLTRVVSLQLRGSGPDVVYGWTGATNAQHPMEHATEEYMLTGGTGDLIKIHRWYGQLFAGLIAKLKATQEGANTLLDNSVVFWTSEMGAGDHRHYDIPYVLAGSAQGYFKTGRYLQYQPINGWQGPPHNQLLVSLCNAMGLSDVTTFGDPRWGSGPLPRLT
jgi:hypothetical protein